MDEWILGEHIGSWTPFDSVSTCISITIPRENIKEERHFRDPKNALKTQI